MSIHGRPPFQNEPVGGAEPSKVPPRNAPAPTSPQGGAIIGAGAADVKRREAATGLKGRTSIPQEISAAELKQNKELALRAAEFLRNNSVPDFPYEKEKKHGLDVRAERNGGFAIYIKKPGASGGGMVHNIILKASKEQIQSWLKGASEARGKEAEADVKATAVPTKEAGPAPAKGEAGVGEWTEKDEAAIDAYHRGGERVEQDMGRGRAKNFHPRFVISEIMRILNVKDGKGTPRAYLLSGFAEPRALPKFAGHKDRFADVGLYFCDKNGKFNTIFLTQEKEHIFHSKSQFPFRGTLDEFITKAINNDLPK